MPADRQVVGVFEKSLPGPTLLQPLGKHRPLGEGPAPHGQVQQPTQRRRLPVHRRGRRPRRAARPLIRPNRVGRDRRRRPLAERRPQVRDTAARCIQRAQATYLVIVEVRLADLMDDADIGVVEG